MIVLLSPAKSLDFESSVSYSEFSTPFFLEEADYLNRKLKKLSQNKVQEMMALNSDLAALNYERIQTWSTPFTPKNAKPSLLVFRGSVYQGLGAQDFSEKKLHFAQNHLRILSGLYGLLRPLDLMQAYRLEMGTRWVVTPSKTNLYKFWDDKITKRLQDELGNQVLINLASNEYFKAVKPKKLTSRIIHCHFRDFKNGEYKAIMTYAKLARGYMAKFIVENQIEDAEHLKAFNSNNYSYNDSLSDVDNWVFTREKVEL